MGSKKILETVVAAAALQETRTHTRLHYILDMLSYN